MPDDGIVDGIVGGNVLGYGDDLQSVQSYNAESKKQKAQL